MYVAATTEERKPPTLADIVREKTDDGRRIIDFFLDVMEDRIDGAELCHRMDAARQLEKHKSKAAAKFLAKYRGVSCGHSTGGRPDPADPCSAEERSLVAVTLNAPATLTKDFLTVLSGIDEFLMARLIRAQTADAGTIIDFLDDVMQDRNDGFKTHHRIAAAKELIVHIVRDEQPESVPAHTAAVPARAAVVPAESLPRTRYGAGTQGGGGGRSTAANSTRTEPVQIVVPAEAGTQGSGGGRNTVANSVRAEPVQIVVPAEAGTQGSGGGRNTAANSVRAEPVLSTAEGSAHPEPRQVVVPAKSLPRTRYGAGTQGGGGGRSTAANSTRTEPVLSTAEGSAHPEPRQVVVPAESLPRTRYGAGTQGGGGGRSTAANSARTEPVLSTIEGSAHPELVEGSRPEFTEGSLTSVHPEPVEGPRPEFTEGPADSSSVVPAKEPAEEPALPSLPQLTTNNQQLETLPARRTRTQRRRDGAARAAALRKGSKRNNEEKDEKPAPVELTPAERRIKERLEQHWYEPDPYGAPIDSASPGRSPP